MTNDPGSAATGAGPSLKQALPVWVKIGLLSFGGPAGQIALMHDEVVTRRRWVAEQAFDRGLSFSMMLPGPEAQQLATWLGWRLHGVPGGIIAGLAFVIPGAALMILLAWIAAAHGAVPWISALFAGVQPVVIALILAAMGKIAGRALVSPWHSLLAAAAFLAIYWLRMPFPAVVALAILAGLLLPQSGASDDAPAPNFGQTLWRPMAVKLIASTMLVAAVFLMDRVTMASDVHESVALLFTTAALVTFGGAYAVLPFVAGQAVGQGWLDAATMLNGLAIAEATPGPLILVNTYAGFFAGWSTGGGASAGIHTALLATFYTFAPSFALILVFAPVVERVHSVPLARKALAGISAAVVGVIANLAVFLGEAALMPQGEPHWPKIVLLGAALLLVFGLRVGMFSLVLCGLGAGLALHFVEVL